MSIEQLIKEIQRYKLEWVIEYLIMIAKSRHLKPFYGKFILQYEASEIIFGRKDETFKPPNRKTEGKE